jgi:anti-sigma regulatory factor (Ser/Thr protein kinase)
MTSLLDHGFEPVPPSHHGCHAGRRYEVVTLPAQPRSVPSARAHVTQVLHEWGLAAMGEDAALIVSELVTNAITASASPLQLCVAADERWLLVVVSDASPRYPLRPGADPDAEGGRGLAAVEALSARWGWHPVTWNGLSKAVWAELTIPNEQAPDVSRADVASQDGGEPMPGT